MHYGDWNDGWGGGWWIAMALMMIAFWGAIAWVVVTLIRQGNRHPYAPPSPPPAGFGLPPDPRQILAERLARGEIEVDDYNARLAALRDDRAH